MLKSTKKFLLIALITMVMATGLTPLVVNATTNDTTDPTIEAVELKGTEYTILEEPNGKVSPGQQLYFRVTDGTGVGYILYQWNRNSGETERVVETIASYSPEPYIYSIKAPTEPGLYEFSIAAQDYNQNLTGWYDFTYYVVTSETELDSEDTVGPNFVFNVDAGEYPDQNATIKTGDKLTLHVSDDTGIYYFAYKWVTEYTSDYYTGSTFIYQPESNTIDIYALAPDGGYLEPGNYYLQMFARDGSGNISKGYHTYLTVADFAKTAALSVTPETNYALGDSLDLTGGTITANWAYEGEKTVSLTELDSSTITTDFDNTKTGNYTVTIKYDGIELSYTVTVSDTELPVINLVGDNPLYWVEGTPFVDPGATVTDNYAQGLEATPTYSDEFNVGGPTKGTYVIKYNANDGTNNALEVTRTVYVSSYAELEAVLAEIETLTSSDYSNWSEDFKKEIANAEAMISAKQSMQSEIDLLIATLEGYIDALDAKTVVKTALDEYLATIPGESEDYVNWYKDLQPLVDEAYEIDDLQSRFDAKLKAIKDIDLSIKKRDEFDEDLLDKYDELKEAFENKDSNDYTASSYSALAELFEDAENQELLQSQFRAIVEEIDEFILVELPKANNIVIDTDKTENKNHIKNGNTITITFESTLPLNLDENATTATINGKTVNVELVDGTETEYQFKYTFGQDNKEETEGFVSYAITLVADTAEQKTEIPQANTEVVLDNTAPEIDTPENVTVRHGEEFTDDIVSYVKEEGITIDDIEKTVYKIVEGQEDVLSDTVDTSVIATYRIEYIVKDKAGNETEVSRTVTVVDYVKDFNITLPKNTYEVKVDNAIDLTDGKITPVMSSGSTDVAEIALPNSSVTIDASNVNFEVVDKYNILVTYEGITKTFEVEVKDTQPPTFTLDGENPQFVKKGNEYTESGIKIKDNYYTDGFTTDITYWLNGTEEDKITTDTTSEYTVKYVVTDSSGNSTEKLTDVPTRTVYVVDYTDLLALIEQAKALLEGNYTTATKEALEAEVTASKAMEQANVSTQEEINEQLSKLEQAIDNLAVVPSITDITTEPSEGYRKAGETITITFNSDVELALDKTTVVIDNDNDKDTQPLTPILVGNTTYQYTVEYILDDEDTEGVISYTITAEGTQNNPAEAITGDTTVIFDNTAPTFKEDAVTNISLTYGEEFVDNIAELVTDNFTPEKDIEVKQDRIIRVIIVNESEVGYSQYTAEKFIVGNYIIHYTVKDLAGNENQVSRNLTVNKATRTIEIVKEGLGKEYDTAPVEIPDDKIKVNKPEDGDTVVFTWYKGEKAEGEGSTTAPTDAGTYTVVATLTGPNYQDATDSATVIIQKADGTKNPAYIEAINASEPTIASEKIIYTDGMTLADISFVETTWVWANPSEEVKVGEHEYSAKYISSNPNYKDVENVPVSVKVCENVNQDALYAYLKEINYDKLIETDYTNWDNFKALIAEVEAETDFQSEFDKKLQNLINTGLTPKPRKDFDPELLKTYEQFLAQLETYKPEKENYTEDSWNELQAQFDALAEDKQLLESQFKELLGNINFGVLIEVLRVPEDSIYTSTDKKEADSNKYVKVGNTVTVYFNTTVPLDLEKGETAETAEISTATINGHPVEIILVNSEALQYNFSYTLTEKDDEGNITYSMNLLGKEKGQSLVIETTPSDVIFDKTPPAVTQPSDVTVKYDKEFTDDIARLIENGATYTTHVVEIVDGTEIPCDDNVVNTKKVGVYKIYYTVTDLAGNVTVVSRTVTVEDYITGIEITDFPKTEYVYNEDLDLTGAKYSYVYATGAIGTEKYEITDKMITGYDKTKIATQTITVIKEGLQPDTVEVTVGKADYDMSKVQFNPQTVPYTGEAITISITGELPTGVEVDNYTYDGLEGTETTDGKAVKVGTYNVTVSFKNPDPDHYNNITPMTTKLTITKGTRTVEFANKTVEITYGKTLNLGYTVNPRTELEETDVRTQFYTENGSQINGTPTQAGTYKAEVIVSETASYNGLTSEQITVVIKKATRTLTVNGVEGEGDARKITTTYTGTKYEVDYDVDPEINPELDGVTVQEIYYTENGSVRKEAPTNAGNYQVEVIVPATANYEQVSSGKIPLIIGKATRTLTVNGVTGEGDARKITTTYTGTEYEVDYVVDPEINPELDGVTVQEIYYTENGSVRNTAPTNAGNYQVEVIVPATTNYEQVSSGKIPLIIGKATRTLTVKGVTGEGDARKITTTYTGTEYEVDYVVDPEINPELDGVTVQEIYYTENGSVRKTAPTNVGKYQVEVIVPATTNYEQVSSGKISLEIEKATIDMSGVKFDDKSFKYDGTEKKIEIELEEGKTLPNGISVSYDSNTRTEIGSQTAKAIFTITLEDAANYNPIQPMEAELTITQNTGSIKLKNAEAMNKTYDSLPVVAPTYDVVGDGEVTVTYYVGTEATGEGFTEAPINAETYTVVVTLATTNNYEGASDSATFTIKKATIDMSDVQFNDLTVEYTGSEFVLEVSNLPEKGVSVTYTNNKATYVTPEGGQKATATFEVTDSNNYYDIETKTMEATLTITPATINMDGVTFEKAEFIYDGSAKSIAVTGLPEEVEVGYTYKDSEGNESTDAPKNVGTYTVTATFEITLEDAANYNPIAPMTTTLTILADKEPPTISFEGDIDLEINSKYEDLEAELRKDVTCADNSGTPTLSVEYKDLDLTKLGEYTITYTVTDAAGNTITATRTVNVVDTEKPEITINEEVTGMTVISDNKVSFVIGTEIDLSNLVKVTDNSGKEITPTYTGNVVNDRFDTYTITYSATDGENTTTFVLLVKITGYPPKVTYYDSKQGAKVEIPDEHTFTSYVTVYHNGTEVVYKKDDDEEVTYTGDSLPTEFVLSEDGKYTFIVTNADGLVTEKTFYVDATPPQITGFKNGNSYNSNEGPVTVTITGAVKATIRIGSSTEEITLENGTYTREFSEIGIYYIQAVDASGNTTAKYCFRIK